MIPSESEPTHRTILIYRESADVDRHLHALIDAAGYSATALQHGDEVITTLRHTISTVAAILLGFTKASQYELEMLRQIRAISRRVPVIIIAGVWSASDVISGLRNGANDFVFEPINEKEFAAVLKRVIDVCMVKVKGGQLHRPPNSPFRSGNRRFIEIEASVEQIGWSGAPVLIQGETGSGKEVLARSLHESSPRAGKSFQKLNCAALPSELVESELFGYERGAFTGAFERKAGMFELADGGTILLDEIGDMDIKLQAKLLQVLQDHEFRKIGGKEMIRVNVRVMAATHRDLERAIHDGTFREDLYYRLNVIVLNLPPLRERTEDTIPLAEFLLQKHAGVDQQAPSISQEMRDAMLAYPWPGNVRELENYMRKFLIFRDSEAIVRELRARSAQQTAAGAEDPVIAVDRLPPTELPVLARVAKATQQAEVDAILVALERTRWNRKQAASILGIDYKSLLYKMKKLKVDDTIPPSHDGSTPLPGQITGVGARQGVV